jgi:nitroreductase
MGIPEKDESGAYISNEDNSEVCIYCGHCVAVCPVKAITLYPMENEENLAEMSDYGIVPFGLTPDECVRTELGSIPDVPSVEALIKSRRMTRSYKKDLVPHHVVRHMVQEILVYAPSGHNTRGYQAKVIEGRESLERLTELSLEYFSQLIKDGGLHSFDSKVFQRMIEAWKHGIDRVFRSAPEAIVIHCKSSIVPADPAVKVMLTYFEMLANSMGLGTVWAGYFMVAANYPAIKKMLNIPDEDTIYGAMMFGYPEFTYDVIPKRPEISLEFI